MADLFSKLERPVMSDLILEWPAGFAAEGIEVESWPQRLPDLYADEPLVLTARLSKRPTSGSLVLRGRCAGQAWRSELPLQGGGQAAGVAVLWARDKIAALSESLHQGADAAKVKQGIVETALRYQLVSKHTSLVAVDVTPTRPADASLKTRAVPTRLPAGWEHGKVFGLPQTATAAALHLWLGLFSLLFAGLLYGWQRRFRLMA